jgi:uncharacterized coiled-coil protein SlyX
MTPTVMTELEARVVDLELRFMTLERFSQELSDVVAEQRRRIDALTLEAKRLRDRLPDGDGSPPANETPPHY